MPVQSQAQRRWAYATAAGETDTDPSVGQDFVDASHGLTGLPERVSHTDGRESSRVRALKHIMRKYPHA